MLPTTVQNDQPHAKMIMQVHDELVFEIAEDCTAKIRELKCAAAELAVPLVVDVRFGGNWDEAH